MILVGHFLLFSDAFKVMIRILEGETDMAEYIIEDNEMKITVNSKGCEVVSAVNKEDNGEYIWCGNPDAWKRHAPVLFPLVGRYKDDESIYEGRVYKMSQHGFARDKEFELVSKTDNRLVMRLVSDEETKSKYPFDFELELEYELTGKSLKEKYTVKNKDSKTMYFSIGAHPAFVSPDNSETLAGCKIKFDAKDSFKYGLLNNDGLLESKEYEMKLEGNGLLISGDLFDKDAIIIENSQVSEVSLENNGKTFVTLKTDAPVLGVWSAKGKNVPFVCIEPWYGRTDRCDYNKKLETREWSNSLPAGQKFEKSFEIIFG